MNILLIGYMASGKSAVGRILANKLNFKFIDLDEYIENTEQMMVKDIFKTKGEIYFRKLENKFLKDILKEKDNIVLSLGGGTPCYGSNMDIILKDINSKSVYLKTSIPTLINRLKNEKVKRPLIAHLHSDELLVEFIGKHIFERSHYYNQAEIKMITDNKSVKKIVEEIILGLF